MDYLDKIFDSLINGFNFPLMLSINVLTWLVIKLLDYINGKKALFTWEKRLTAVLCGIILSAASLLGGISISVCIYTCIMSLVSWDIIFKPIVKRICGGNMDYFKE